MNRCIDVSGAEYCVKETFHAECPDNQLIMMTEAVYGMMERNRCVNPQDDMSKILHFIIFFDVVYIFQFT